MRLREYQEQALTAIPSEGKCVVALPTGAGKSLLFAELAKRRGGKSLILAHRDELVRQAVDKVKMVWAGAEIGVVKAEENEIDAPVCVASVQTLSRQGRLDDYLRVTKGHSVTLVTDECHHSLSDSYKKIYSGLNGQAGLHVGFTATPYRSDGKKLEDVFPEGIVYEKSILWMIQQGYLCNLRATQVSLAVDLSGVKVRGGDFSEEDLGRALKAPGASEAIARAYVENASPKKAVCFTASVAQAHEVAEKLVNMGVAAACVWGEQPLEERRKVLRRFSEGQLRVVTNMGILLEGYDEPSIECILWARPTLSKLLYTQGIGRATRLYPGKSEAHIIDFRPSSDREIETMASMFGITERAAEKGIEALLQEVSEHPGGLVGNEAIEGFLKPPSGRLHWVADGRRFLLSLGDATLALVPAGLTWEIKEFPRGKDALTKKLYSGLSLDYAQGIAEDLVRSAGSWGLASEGAHWRMGPPSEGQMRVFSEKGWGTPRSKGTAADRMTVEFNRRRS